MFWLVLAEERSRSPSVAIGDAELQVPDDFDTLPAINRCWWLTTVVMGPHWAPAKRSFSSLLVTIVILNRIELSLIRITTRQIHGSWVRFLRWLVTFLLILYPLLTKLYPNVYRFVDCVDKCTQFLSSNNCK